jgi:hypothetical protein
MRRPIGSVLSARLPPPEMRAILFLCALAIAAVSFASIATAATTPRGAALVARNCLRAHGWTATLADRGRTVNGRAPRKLASYPYRPWYSVAFYKTDRVYANEIRMKLNRAEGRVATLCRKQALRQ